MSRNTLGKQSPLSHHTIVAFIVSLGSASATPLQTDTCTNPTDLGSSLGSFGFDSSLSTTSGFSGNLACGTGSATISQDVFWTWTAPNSGTWQFDTGGTGFDTKLSVHSGVDCSATCWSYNDNSNGQHSAVQLNLPTGATMLIQVGSASQGTGAVGTLNISQFVDPCQVLPDDSFEPNDACPGVPITPGQYTSLRVATPNPDYYSVSMAANQVLVLTDTTLGGNEAEYALFDATCSNLLDSGATGLTYAASQAETVIIEVTQSVDAVYVCSIYEFNLLVFTSPCNAAFDDRLEDNDICATASQVVDGLHPDLWASKTDPDHYAFRVADGETVNVDVLFTHANGDIDAFLRSASSLECGNGNGADELADGFSSTDDENLTWTNLTGSCQDVVLEVNVWDNPGNAADCNQYDLLVSGSDAQCATGIVFCSPNGTNCSGRSTKISGYFLTGIPILGQSGLHLTATDGPSNEFGYFLVSSGMADPGTPVSNGSLCLLDNVSSPIGRYNIFGSWNSIGKFSADGSTYDNLVGTGSSAGATGFDVPIFIPPTGVPTIVSGSTWNFQLWHRDSCTGAGSSNFSNGLSVTF